MRVQLVEATELHDLRRLVLRNNDPAVSVADARDGDADALHLAVLDDDRVVGCGSFYPSPGPASLQGLTYQLRYLATDAEYQGRGVGTMLLTAAEDRLASRGVVHLWANGRDTALGFYDQAGWARIPCSEHRSPETDLPHTVITKTIHSDEPVTLDDVTPADAHALADMRRAMAFANHLNSVEGQWLALFPTYFLESLERGTTMGVVMRTSDGRIVASALADLQIGVPMRSTQRGRVAYVHSVSTRPAFRRRGLSRILMDALLVRLDEWDVDAIDLHASTQGEALYRDLGFTERQTGVAMRRYVVNPYEATLRGDPAS